ILPASDCGKGQLAVPGDASCHDVAPCGQSKWGAAPIEASTVFVDASYAGGASDGSQNAPWTSVQEGVEHATDAAVGANAAGTYVEDVAIAKRVRLWGRCPSEVELDAVMALSAVFLKSGASGAEVHDLALGGPTIGLLASGVENVVVDRVWIHDAGGRGID